MDDDAAVAVVIAPLHEQVAVVTGGASGIGKAIATRLRDAGATVVLSDIDPTALDATAAELGLTGVRADVTIADEVQALADHVVSVHGTVDIVVNNAGVGSMGRIAEMTLADWRWMLDVNLFGVIHGIHSFLPILRANERGGHLINTASMAGFVANPNMGAYTAAKAAVVAISETLALECAEDGGRVAVSVLCPGPVLTNIKSSLRTRPAGETGGLFDIDASTDGFMSTLRWMDPLAVGDLVVDAIADRRLYIITHPELWPAFAARVAAVQASFGDVP